MDNSSLPYELKSFAASIETFAHSTFRAADLRRSPIETLPLLQAASDFIERVASVAGRRAAARLRREMNEAALLFQQMSNSYLHGRDSEQRHALAQIDLRGAELARYIVALAEQLEHDNAPPPDTPLTEGDGVHQKTPQRARRRKGEANEEVKKCIEFSGRDDLTLAEVHRHTGISKSTISSTEFWKKYDAAAKATRSENAKTLKQNARRRAFDNE